MTVHTPKAPCDVDVVDQVLPIFGTVNNAQRLLRLSLPYAIANAAFRGQPVTAEVQDVVIEAWRTWKRLFVRGHALGVGADLTLRLPETIETAQEAIEDLEERETSEWRRRLA